ncbi:Oidioi.mRNA.OKI2018_I69.chr1.g1433.t1.cds [Oikopleura dioica]|uniref:Oidioi.mRNA.OKI2018_I69.chr1.g1433.t1.cds n=1 Tax=Oikopleura dioica TaxID=34765 RepID=A0ABN7SU86_OIKDI|nr:Oidioi.mRNA.OKI2018_I69.chr1.g1433.t1.cds [Oikopleura dioica]
MPKSIKDLAPIPGCLRMPVKMTLRRVLVPDASNSTVLRLFTDEKTTWYIQIDDIAVHLTPDIKIWHGCMSKSQDCDVWKIERRVEKTDQFKTMIIFESCPKTKRYKIEELMKFVYQSGAIFSNTETRDLGYLDLQDKKKAIEMTKNEPDGNFLAPPRASEKSTIYLDIPSNDYYYILPPKEN